MLTKHSNKKSKVLQSAIMNSTNETTGKESILETGTVERPRTKLDFVYAIRDLLGITQRGIMEPYEFEQMRKPSLIALYEALKERKTEQR
jgi:hypothetical protein